MKKRKHEEDTACKFLCRGSSIKVVYLEGYAPGKRLRNSGMECALEKSAKIQRGARPIVITECGETEGFAVIV